MHPADALPPCSRACPAVTSSLPVERCCCPTCHALLAVHPDATPKDRCTMHPMHQSIVAIVPPLQTLAPSPQPRLPQHDIRQLSQYQALLLSALAARTAATAALTPIWRLQHRPDGLVKHALEALLTEHQHQATGQ